MPDEHNLNLGQALNAFREDIRRIDMNPEEARHWVINHQIIEQNNALMREAFKAQEAAILQEAVRQIDRQNAPPAKKEPEYKIHWGGADVDPSFYNRPKSYACGGTYAAIDQKELDEMFATMEKGIPIIGICRGAQLLNVANGGILVQHIENHATGRPHHIFLQEEPYNPQSRIYEVNSTHHQMMVAHEDGIILGKDNNLTPGVHWDNVNDEYVYKYVVEVVYYPKTKSLCIQPHPEWMDQESEFVKWINRFIKNEWNIGPINFAEEEAKFKRAR